MRLWPSGEPVLVRSAGAAHRAATLLSRTAPQSPLPASAYGAQNSGGRPWQRQKERSPKQHEQQQQQQQWACHSKLGDGVRSAGLPARDARGRGHACAAAQRAPTTT
eukprot:359003-Chlamydomonas_euryale.AAC.5